MKDLRPLTKYLAGLGYGSRKEVETAIRRGRVGGLEGGGKGVVGPSPIPLRTIFDLFLPHRGDLLTR